MNAALIEIQLKEANKKIEQMKFRHDLLNEEIHTLKIKLAKKESLIEDLFAKIENLKSKTVTIPVKGSVA